MLGKSEGRRRRGLSEDEMAGWNPRKKRHELGQTAGGGEAPSSPGVLPSLGSQRARHYWAMNHSNSRMEQTADESLRCSADSAEKRAPMRAWRAVQRQCREESADESLACSADSAETVPTGERR